MCIQVKALTITHHTVHGIYTLKYLNIKHISKYMLQPFPFISAVMDVTKWISFVPTAK